MVLYLDTLYNVSIKWNTPASQESSHCLSSEITNHPILVFLDCVLHATQTLLPALLWLAASRGRMMEHQQAYLGYSVQTLEGFILWGWVFFLMLLCLYNVDVSDESRKGGGRCRSWQKGWIFTPCSQSLRGAHGNHPLSHQFQITQQSAWEQLTYVVLLKSVSFWE